MDRTSSASFDSLDSSLSGFQIWSFPEPLDFAKTHALQLELVRLRQLNRIPDTFLMLEHEKVITLGRGLQNRQALVIPPLLDFISVERGGGLTLHTPGQWVCYPIVQLGQREDGFGQKKDIRAFVRRLESLVIQSVQEMDPSISLGIDSAAAGIWSSKRKVASVGLAFRRFVSFHGIAINVNNNLAQFFGFSPCGFESGIMTRLADLSTNSKFQDFKTFRLYFERIICAKIASFYTPFDLEKSRILSPKSLVEADCLLQFC